MGHVRRGAGGDHADDAGRPRVEHRPGRRIGEIDDRGRIRTQPREEPGLRGRVGRHVAVVVEMVAREVGEDRDVEVDVRDPALVERVAGGLHHDPLAPGLREIPEQACERDSARRGERRRGRPDPVVGLDGPDEAATPERRGQQLTGERRDRGLAVGPGDAGESHPPFRVTVESEGEVTADLRGIRRRDPHHRGRNARRHGRDRENRPGPAFDRIGDVVATVVHRSRTRHEHRAVPDETAVLGDPGDSTADGVPRDDLDRPGERRILEQVSKARLAWHGFPCWCRCSIDHSWPPTEIPGPVGGQSTRRRTNIASP